MFKNNINNCSEILSGRKFGLFKDDLIILNDAINDAVENKSFLVVGGAGSIGHSTIQEIIKRKPKKIHVVDINENGLAEVVRNCRSSFELTDTELKVFCFSALSKNFSSMVQNQDGYDYILNLAAIKHVRSEEDPFTLLNMIYTNIILNRQCAELALKMSGCKYFCVSTDKAANPHNAMGATKKLMEMAVSEFCSKLRISSARFANVLFSNGSLTASFKKRIELAQPLAIPCNIERYFITLEEAGQLCLISCIFGDSSDIFFPKTDRHFKLITFEEIVKRFLKFKGLNPVYFERETDARKACKKLNLNIEYPVLITNPDTTGEKPFEEFHLNSDTIQNNKFEKIGVVKNGLTASSFSYSSFIKDLEEIETQKQLVRNDLIDLLKTNVPSFKHVEKGKFLNSRM